MTVFMLEGAMNRYLAQMAVTALTAAQETTPSTVVAAQIS